LADAAWLWATSALSASPGARRYYDQLVASNHSHNEAVRALANRFAGILDSCLRHHRLYIEEVAWPSSLEVAA
jgi:hypothetical protein